MPIFIHRRMRNLLLAGAAMLAIACGSGGGGGATGTLSVPLTDAPFPAHDGCLAEALITIDGVEAKVGQGFHDVALVDPAPDGTVTLDLLTLRAGVMDSLALSDLPTGSVSEIRLHIVESVLVFEDGSPEAAFKVPSGDASGLKVRIEPPAVVAAGETTTLILDVDLADSFHTRGLGGDPTCDELKEGEDRVLFSPVVRVNNESTDAIILGAVFDDAATPVPDVEVSAFPANADIVADPVPVATTFSAPDGLEGVEAGDYALLVPAGSYDLYLRDPGMEEKSLAAEDVLVSAGESLEGVDLTLLP